MNATQENQVTPFIYENAKIIAVAKTSRISDSYQICSDVFGWTDAAYSAEYLVSIGADSDEIARIQCL